MSRTSVWILVLVVLHAPSVFAGNNAIKRLTQRHQPAEWELHQIVHNPFQPWYETELSVPDTTWLFIDVFQSDWEDPARRLVRRVVQGWYSPAVYSINWNCLCDSLDLPVTVSGRYSMIVRAYGSDGLDNLVFEDSVELLVGTSWSTVEADSLDFGFSVLANWMFKSDLSLVETTVHRSYPRFFVEGARLRKAVKESDADRVAIKFGFEEYHARYSPFRSDARAYNCVRDSSSPGGYRILCEKRPVRDMHAVWLLSLEDDELLMINCTSHWPVVVDASAFISKLRTSGDLR